MKDQLLLICLSLFIFSWGCTNDDSLKDNLIGTAEVGAIDTGAVSCSEVDFGNWEQSQYALPYFPGETRRIGLSSCSGSFHSQGLHD